MEGTWLKDLDSFGKQDPYIKWMYRGDTYMTHVREDAGKEV